MNKRGVFLENGYCYTLTPQGDRVLASMEDYDLLLEYSWFRHGDRRSKYAGAKVNGKHVFLHKMIQARLGFTGLCDHVNRERYDNRRENLRPATAELNCQNVSISKRNTSGFMGVHWHKSSSKWQTSIRYMENGQYTRKHLGSFETAEEAARAYDRAAKVYHGDHSTTNESLGLL